VFGGTEENQGAQALLDPIFATLEECLKPAEIFIDAIKAAASLVGVDL
jgi:hypothetical protein